MLQTLLFGQKKIHSIAFFILNIFYSIYNNLNQQVNMYLTLISQWKPSLKYSSIGGMMGRVFSTSGSDF